MFYLFIFLLLLFFNQKSQEKLVKTNQSINKIMYIYATIQSFWIVFFLKDINIFIQQASRTHSIVK